MIVIGITGSIGMGKSTAAAMLARMGGAVHDSDKISRDSLKPYGAAFEEVALTFPKAWDKKKHLIKRDVLGEIVFNDNAKKQELENIIHPVVKASQLKFIRDQKKLGKKFVVLDIPLLFETGAEQRCDYTICVFAPDHIQRRRVLSRANMTKKKFQAILHSQMPSAEKCARADFIVPTGLGLAYTYRQLKHIIMDITK